MGQRAEKLFLEFATGGAAVTDAFVVVVIFFPAKDAKITSV